MKQLHGGTLADGTYTFVIRAANSLGQRANKVITFTLKTDAPTPIDTLASVNVASTAANQNFLLAGLFDDRNIQNTHVTVTVLDGSVEKQIHLELFDREAGASVQNFLNYFDDYAQSGGVVVHRVVNQDGLKVVQTGGNTFNTTTNQVNTTHITTDTVQVRNEFSEDRPNTRGTLAWAKPAGQVDGASSEFFFNLDDANADTLNINNVGGFAVFGQVANPDSTQGKADLALLDQILNTPGRNAQKTLSTTAQDFPQMPVKGDVPAGTQINPTADTIYRFKSFAIDNPTTPELTYSVTSSNTTVVTASVGTAATNANATLVLDYQAAGTSTITVTATDKTASRRRSASWSR